MIGMRGGLSPPPKSLDLGAASPNKAPKRCESPGGRCASPFLFPLQVTVSPRHYMPKSLQTTCKQKAELPAHIYPYLQLLKDKCPSPNSLMTAGPTCCTAYPFATSCPSLKPPVARTHRRCPSSTTTFPGIGRARPYCACYAYYGPFITALTWLPAYSMSISCRHR